MNISVKCNCCCKENVCKYKLSYENDCVLIKSVIYNPTTEVSIKCSEFIPKQTYREENK